MVFDLTTAVGVSNLLHVAGDHVFTILSYLLLDSMHVIFGRKKKFYQKALALYLKSTLSLERCRPF